MWLVTVLAGALVGNLIASLAFVLWRRWRESRRISINTYLGARVGDALTMSDTAGNTRGPFYVTAIEGRTLKLERSAVRQAIDRVLRYPRRVWRRVFP